VSGRFVARRIAVAVATLIAIIVFNFFLFRTLGDPKKDLIRGRLKPDVRAAIIHERGYDKGELTQFWRYVVDLAHGDLGDSSVSEKPVIDEVGSAIPNTLLLLGLATLLSMWIGTRLGILAAWRRGRPKDTLIGQISLAFYSMPDFWLGMVFIGVFAGSLAWLPGGLKATPGGGGGFDHIRDVATHMILPTVTLALGEIGQYVFISRAAVADVMDADHVLTARAIGLQPLAVRRRHIVPSARLPMVTQIALNLGFVLGGAITVEALFSWPGIGLATLNAIQAKDFPMLQGLYLVTSLLVIVCNLTADLLYARLDPRVRTE
jgi:ABC-type dipeptide/oligopeptide/nickel transport system permease component